MAFDPDRTRPHRRARPSSPGRPFADLASRFGLAPIFEAARMHRGPAPELPLDGISVITSLELG
jgi:hypothetical protein